MGYRRILRPILDSGLGGNAVFACCSYVTCNEALAAHWNLQLPTCCFLQAFEYDQICNRPRLSAMVTAWVRSLACSLSTRFLIWKLTVVSEIDN